jgi:hypothetical protein
LIGGGDARAKEINGARMQREGLDRFMPQ